jgi:type I restriction-modification system DNA methylase subunit
MIFRHQKPADRQGEVLFISAESEYEEEKRHRHLSSDNIERIVQCYLGNELTAEEKEGQWSQQEVDASVEAYLQMLQEEVAGRKYNKAGVNRELREGVLKARSRGSIEMRMCNISTVVRDHGKRFIDGYKPRENVGANVYLMIEHALDRFGLAHGFTKDPAAISRGVATEAGILSQVVSVEEILETDANLSPRRYFSSESNLFFDEVRRLGADLYPELSSTKVSRSSAMHEVLRIRIKRGVGCNLRWMDETVTFHIKIADEKLAQLLNHSPYEFHEQVAKPAKWRFDSDAKNSMSLSIHVSLTEEREQKDWTVQKKVQEALALYGRIKKFVLDRISSADGDGEENSDSLSG